MQKGLKLKYVKNGLNETVTVIFNGFIVTITSTPQANGSVLALLPCLSPNNDKGGVGCACNAQI